MTYTKYALIGLIWCLILPFTSATIEENAILYYSFDETYYNEFYVYDETDNSINASRNGGVADNQPGIINTSFFFDGNDDFLETVGASGYLHNKKAISLWLKGTNNDNNVDVVIGHKSGTYFDVSIDGTNQRVVVYQRDSSGNDHGIADTEDLFYNITDGNWNHLVIRHKGGVVQIGNTEVYFNGQDVTSTFTDEFVSGTDPANVTTNDWRIGISQSTLNPYPGYIDELMILEDYRLEGSDIINLYNNGTAANPFRVITPPDNDTNQTQPPINQTSPTVATDITPLSNMLERVFILGVWLAVFALAILARGKKEDNVGFFTIIQLFIGVFAGALWLPISIIMGLPIIVLATGLPMALVMQK